MAALVSRTQVMQLSSWAGVSQQAMATLFWLLDPVPGVPPQQVSLVPATLTHRSTTMSS